MAEEVSPHDPWPLRHLVLRTPRLELRPDDDAGLSGGRVAGVEAVGFRVTREIDTGSWIGMRHQGRGIGTEMRAAVLQWGFDHLGATQARSAAFVDNAASLRVSEKLGYRPDGAVVQVRRGRRAEKTRLLVTASTFLRPGWTLTVEGLAACRAMLGAEEDAPMVVKPS